MTTANFAEVASVYVRQGATLADIATLRARLPFPLVPIDDQLAIKAAAMVAHTRSAGLSLGDRFCLALARLRGVTAVTADQAWITVASAVGAQVELIR